MRELKLPFGLKFRFPKMSNRRTKQASSGRAGRLAVSGKILRTWGLLLLSLVANAYLYWGRKPPARLLWCLARVVSAPNRDMR